MEQQQYGSHVLSSLLVHTSPIFFSLRSLVTQNPEIISMPTEIYFTLIRSFFRNTDRNQVSETYRSNKGWTKDCYVQK